jgi:hypothetical protein
LTLAPPIVTRPEMLPVVAVKPGRGYSTEIAATSSVVNGRARLVDRV